MASSIRVFRATYADGHSRRRKHPTFHDCVAIFTPQGNSKWQLEVRQGELGQEVNVSNRGPDDSAVPNSANTGQRVVGGIVLDRTILEQQEAEQCFCGDKTTFEMKAVKLEIEGEETGFGLGSSQPPISTATFSAVAGPAPKAMTTASSGRTSVAATNTTKQATTASTAFRPVEGRRKFVPPQAMAPRPSAVAVAAPTHQTSAGPLQRSGNSHDLASDTSWGACRSESSTKNSMPPAHPAPRHPEPHRTSSRSHDLADEPSLKRQRTSEPSSLAYLNEGISSNLLVGFHSYTDVDARLGCLSGSDDSDLDSWSDDDGGQQSRHSSPKYVDPVTSILQRAGDDFSFHPAAPDQVERMMAVPFPQNERRFEPLPKPSRNPIDLRKNVYKDDTSKNEQRSTKDAKHVGKPRVAEKLLAVAPARIQFSTEIGRPPPFPARFDSTKSYLEHLLYAMQYFISSWLRESFAVRIPPALSKSSKSDQAQLRVASLRRAGLHVYTDVCVLSPAETPPDKDVDTGSDCQFLLKVGDLGAETFSKGDVWVLFLGWDSLHDISNNSATTILCQSTMHGKPSSGCFGMDPIPGYRVPTQKRAGAYVAVHSGCAMNDFAALQWIEKGPSAPTSLVHYLANPKPKNVPPNSNYLFLDMERSEAEFEFNTLCGEMMLNSDQQAVLVKCLDWFRFTDDDVNSRSISAASTVITVHGVFGSGKSRMLCVLILGLIRLIELAAPQDSDAELVAPPIRILVCAATNTAVDRVLLELAEHGCDQFLRVGSVGSIAPGILPYSVMRTGSEAATKETLRILRASLKEVTNSSERDTLVEQIKQVQDGRASEREKRLSLAPIVGVTAAAAASFPVLAEQQFSIVLLDESSQLLEPQAVAPLIRFRASKLLCVGDPKQLPPPAASSLPRDRGAAPEIARTLFERIASVAPPILLRTQYRCHPVIAQLSSAAFYNNMLRTGVGGHERSALVFNEGGNRAAWPPVVLVDDELGEETQQARSKSFVNEGEAKFVCALVLRLVSRAPDHTIGVICTYKSQAELLSLRLGELLGRSVAVSESQEGTQDSQEALDAASRSRERVLVSTVDSFQGGERDIIVMCCTRTATWTSFVDDAQRLNVAITRARHHLFIVCRVATILAMPRTREQPVHGPGGHSLWAQLFKRTASVGGMAVQSSRTLLERWKTEQDGDLPEGGEQAERLEARVALSAW